MSTYDVRFAPILGRAMKTLRERKGWSQEAVSCRWFAYSEAEGYVSHLIAAPAWTKEGDALSYVPRHDARAFTREQMLEDPERRAALERWEAGDDSRLEILDEAQRALFDAQDEAN